MHIKLITDDIKLKTAFELAGKYIETFNCVSYDKELKVIPVKRDIDGYKVFKSNDGICIEYGNLASFWFALSAVQSGETDCENSIAFKRLGVMLDCARGAVPNIEALKRYVITLSLAGYNYLGLYVEDCLEVDEEPFFGYMRGRFAKREIKELVSFADFFGVEIVPYIQTLAHLARIFNHWEQYYSKVRDFGDILLIGEPRTYQLIDNILRTVSETFTCKTVHIGMDEAFMMGLGKYRQLHGYPNRAEIFLQHLVKVADICQKYGLKPYAWADMFEHYVEEGNQLYIPKNVGLTVWKYSPATKEKYQEDIKLAKRITPNVTFAAGAHKWYGFAPLNGFTDASALPAVNACKGNVSDFCVTLWGDDGAECSYNAVWYSLINIAAEACLKPLDTRRKNLIAMLLTGYNMEELLCLDLPNIVFNHKMEKPINVSKYLLFEDLFMGISDRSASLKYTAFFAANHKVLEKLSARDSYYSYMFDEMSKLCHVLELKGCLRIELLSAYKSNDKTALETICRQTIPLVIKRLQMFMDAFERKWDIENKSYGFEVHNVRFGGLIERLKRIKKIVERYLDGTLDKIDELEQTNLSPPPADDEYNGALCYNSYEQNVTYSTIAYKLYN